MICGSIGAPPDYYIFQLTAECRRDFREHLLAHIDSGFEKRQRDSHCAAHFLLHFLFADLVPNLSVNGFEEKGNEYERIRLEFLEVSRCVAKAFVDIRSAAEVSVSEMSAGKLVGVVDRKDRNEA